MSKNVNPNLHNFIKKNKLFTAQEYAEGIISGDRNFLSRAITLLESTKPGDSELSSEIIRICLPYSGN